MIPQPLARRSFMILKSQLNLLLIKRGSRLIKNDNLRIIGNSLTDFDHLSKRNRHIAIFWFDQDLYLSMQEFSRPLIHFFSLDKLPS